MVTTVQGCNIHNQFHKNLLKFILGGGGGGAQIGNIKKLKKKNF
jgi:hypothetical protein